MSLPWALKPLFGLLTDFVPIGRTRRKAYLAAAGAITGAVFGWLALGRGFVDSRSALLTWLFVATIAVALADVATDALVVEWGQIHNMTGRYQAAVWSCLYASGIVTGSLGGTLSETGRVEVAFALCAAAGCGVFALAMLRVREPARVVVRLSGREVARSLESAAKSRGVIGVGLFVALWNFNPLANPVLHLHMTGPLGLGEQAFGNALSLFSLTSLAAAVLYGLYCARVPMAWLVQISIVFGVVANFAYAAVLDAPSAAVALSAVGFTYMTATLIQFDLAARACPSDAAGTVFATIMAVANLSTLVSTWLGGLGYEWLGTIWGHAAAFRILIGASAVFTAGCWLIVPFLPRSLLRT
jgi:MFS family permease